jgi:3-hydroxybutyryl-CoA dehydratase
MKVGDTVSISRTFTVEDVERFTEVSLDRAPWHIAPDAEGRLLVHGLLTAALSTQIGGAIGFMARRFDTTFLLPVYTGDEVQCTLLVTHLSAAPSAALTSGEATTTVKRPATRMVADATFTNQRGAVVATIKCSGVLPRSLASVLAEDFRAKL